MNAERKAVLLEEIAEKENIPLKQVLAIGDGANDLPMLMTAGLGVAFNAKPLVQLEVCQNSYQISQYLSLILYVTQAPTRLNAESLLDILYVLGFTKEEQEALLA